MRGVDACETRQRPAANPLEQRRLAIPNASGADQHSVTEPATNRNDARHQTDPQEAVSIFGRDDPTTTFGGLPAWNSPPIECSAEQLLADNFFGHACCSGV